MNERIRELLAIRRYAIRNDGPDSLAVVQADIELALIRAGKGTK